MDPAIVDGILDRYKRKGSALIGILQDIQQSTTIYPRRPCFT